MEYFQELVAVVVDRLSQGFEQRRLRAPDTSAQQTVSRLDVQVVPGAGTALSSFGHVGGKVGLVGCLVGRKSYVAVYAVYARRGFKAVQLVVFVAYQTDELVDICLKPCAQFSIFFFVGVEPLPIIVCTQFTQEMEYIFH